LIGATDLIATLGLAAYMPTPAHPKIYHIAHVDRLASIVGEGFLWCDAKMTQSRNAGATIGMSKIKARRLTLSLSCYPDLQVGACVPFYFCSRSIMLFLIHRRNDELDYKGGQEPIVHLEADFYRAITWAEQHRRRWAFTLSNAGTYYFEDCSDVAQLSRINWDAVQARTWAGADAPGSVKQGKQAEFLMEQSFPWELVERVGVFSNAYVQSVSAAMGQHPHRPRIEVMRQWYY
jgi:hypothetical protein